MFIAVTSPKKGLGQTVSSINLAANITAITQEKCLLIDFNHKYRDVARYLSASAVNKGIDDFKNLYDIGLNNESDLFKKCTKRVHEKIDIMTANICSQIDRDDIERLVDLSKREYSFIIADTTAGEGEMTKIILERADVIVVILSQDINIVKLSTANSKHSEQIRKNIYIVNKYIKEINRQKVGMCFDKVQRLLKQKGVKRENVFKLDFDASLLNECNESALLNYTFCSSEETVNSLQNREIVEHILSSYANYSFDKENNKRRNTKWDIRKFFAKREEKNRMCDLNE
ncbi:MAG: hypothetical protein COA82_04570 [Alkaliphilus sp.]|nr:hypothetical protein [bacterium AH-315-L21]MBN4062615.1 hypothetical protein [Alkaliphilus sp. AH-315-G20]PHS35338.1 MAG: hypothetical protein COA82_04570 [Alkaliphilus sp.]